MTMSKPEEPAAKAVTLDEAADEARCAAELAAANIPRYLRLQRDFVSQVTPAQPDELVEAAKVTAASAELAAVNIKRFLRLQRESVSRVTPV